MKKSNIVIQAITIGATLSVVGCSKPAPEAKEPAPEVQAQPEAVEAAPLATPTDSSKEYFVEGVAGGTMIRQIQLEAEVVSVDQEKREAVLRGPGGKETTVKVGKEAVNFYQVAPGDRVNVLMARELTVYVPADPKKSTDGKPAEGDGTAIAGARVEDGQKPAGVVVSSTKITSKITALDAKARTATLTLESGEAEVFNVRPDVDMTKYKVGQEVVFLITDLLALEVHKL